MEYDFNVYLKHKREAAERARKRHYDRITLIIGGTSAFIALVAAGAAVWAGFEAHKTRINDERPYLAVDVEKESAPFAVFGTDEHVVYIEVASFGKSPAQHIHGSCEVFHKSLTDKPSFVSIGKEFENSYLLPSHTIPLMCPYYITGKESSSQDDPLSVMGYVKYTDNGSDLDVYETPFCYNIGTLRQKLLIVPCSVESKGLPPLK